MDGAEKHPSSSNKSGTSAMTLCLPVQALYNILLSDRRLLATIKAINWAHLNLMEASDPSASKSLP